MGSASAVQLAPEMHASWRLFAARAASCGLLPPARLTKRGPPPSQPPQVAGHETTGSVLTWTVDLLARHPDKMRKVGVIKKFSLIKVVLFGALGKKTDEMRWGWHGIGHRMHARRRGVRPANGCRTVTRSACCCVLLC